MCSIIMQMAIPNAASNIAHKLNSKSCGVFSNMKSAATPTTRYSSLQSSHIQTQRRSGGYQPALWDFNSIQSLHTEYKQDVHQTRAQGLIAQVKMLLHLPEEEEVDDHIVRRLELIDELHMLGVSCHFENEILHILNLTYLILNYKTDDHQRDLYSTSLRFRLLRKHGFTVSQEVFDCFKNENGSEFQPSLAHDIKGVIQLYEASFLLKQGEHTLELARGFATNILQKKLDDGDDDAGVLASIRGALEFPSHWRVQMPNARSFIDAYKRRPDMNPTLLELAELDFNIVQAQFQEELKEASRWWESTGLVEQLPFVRDRIVECYLWTTGVLQRREHGYERIMLTKINALVTTIDDVFDIYGTLEELHLFTTAIQRWDVESLEQLPTYMKLCYLALYSFVNEMAYATLVEKGFNSIPYLRKTWVDLIEAYLIEAKWYHSGHKPSLEEYIKNAWISIGGVPILSHLFFRLSDSTEKEVVDSMHKYHDIVRASCTILRLADDMGTSLDEVERGDVPKSIQCYMNEKNASEEEARAHVRGVIEQTWAKMNTELLMDDDSQSQILFSKAYVEAAANLGRMAQLIYQDGSDGFGMQHSKVNKLLRGLLFEPYICSSKEMIH